MRHKPNKACAEKVETRPERKEAKMENNAISYGGSYGNSGSGKKLPEKKFRAGAVAATIWRNESAKGSYATVQLDRSYKDGDAWKSTGSLRINDLPKAVLVLNKAYEYLFSKPELQEREEAIAIEDVM